MTIKEFFENCAYCYHVYVYVDYEDETGKYQSIDTRELYTDEELENFLNAYGNEEIKKWSVENSEDDTDIAFYLKRLIDKR